MTLWTCSIFLIFIPLVLSLFSYPSIYLFLLHPYAFSITFFLFLSFWYHIYSSIELLPFSLSLSLKHKQQHIYIYVIYNIYIKYNMYITFQHKADMSRNHYSRLLFKYLASTNTAGKKLTNAMLQRYMVDHLDPDLFWRTRTMVKLFVSVIEVLVFL